MKIKIAIIGSGPSAFYTAQYLLKEEGRYEIDIIEKLFSPFGLVRYGVSPDHQNTKNVIRVFNRTLNNENVEFFGDVEVNNSPSIDDLVNLYDATVVTTGMGIDRPINIKGADKIGFYGATEFVNWYNGHPEYENLNPYLNTDTAIIIGNGNVAIDCARLLVRTKKEMENSDITQYASKALFNSPIKKVYIIGRRGPLDSKFTTVEIREMGELLNCDSILSQGILKTIDSNLLNEKLPKQYKILTNFPEKKHKDSKKAKTVEFMFYSSPIELLGDDKLRSVKFKNNLSKDNEIFTINTGLIITAIGYLGDKIKGIKTDKSGMIIHNNNKIKDRLFTAGWVARGPSGVIGTNKHDGANVAKQIFNSIKSKKSPGRVGLKKLLNKINKRYISKKDWIRINEEEISRGKDTLPRIKFTSNNEVYNFIDNHK